MRVGRFTFHENIQNRYLGALPANLRVVPGANAIEELVLLRLLIGTIKIEDSLSGNVIEQRENYSLTDFATNRVISTKPIKATLDSLTLVDLSNYITKSVRHGNKKLFRSLLLEISNYFLCKSRMENVSAFLHLYRALELISYCFPLYFASKATSYHNSYLALKDFFKGAEGERDFFNKFVNNNLFMGDPLLDIHLRINFDNSDPVLQKQYFDSFMKMHRQNSKIVIVNNSPNDFVTTSRRSLISLIITLRNRTFHLLEGDYNDNITAEELYDFNGFYNNFNDNLLNWISVIYFKILLKAVDFER
jgi:hypothetical protein